MEDLKILFVDDDRQSLDIAQRFLSRFGYQSTTESDSRKACEIIKNKPFDVVFTDLNMPEIDGIELLRTTKEYQPDTEVVIVTGYGTIESAIEALKLGSYDYLQKPINSDRFKILIDRIQEKKNLKDENQFIKERLKERYRYDDLVGISPKMQEIYKIIDRISIGGATVLIQGESGTGKELVAKVIHKNSKRKNNSFVPVNCGAISENLLESELFGHQKGAFTGAVKNSIGLFQAADCGSIFLDEIAELSPTLQVKLLRVLQEKTIRPVGKTREIKVDVRVIAATNKQLYEEIKNKTFREDLFYRLNVISITMPSLREIKDDIPFLISHFLNKYRKDNNQKTLRIAPDTMDIMTNYNWPGNVRELENTIERAVALGVTHTITPSDLPAEIQGFGDQIKPLDTSYNLKENEILLLKRALDKTNGDKAGAAKLLGINTTTVYRKLQKYKIGSKDSE